jgi:glycosyltransferase involved in cell wall biosynthesis
MPPLEAMASGIPVVSSNGGSLSEVVSDAGLLRSPTDEEGMARDVCALLQNSVQREEFVGKGMVRSRMFSWEQNAARTREVYDSLLRRGRC